MKELLRTQPGTRFFLHLAAFSLLLVNGHTGIGQETITFDASGNFSGTNYIESKVRFLCSKGVMNVVPAGVTNPTPYLIVDSPGARTSITSTSGESFGLHSVDLADPVTVDSSIPIRFRGMRTDGSTVTNTFTTPPVGPMILERYFFSPGFASGLTNVELIGRFALDNLSISNGMTPPAPVDPLPPTFGPAVILPLTGVYASVVADLNQDGHADIVTSHYQRTSFLFNNGDGTFLSPTEYFRSTPPYTFLRAGDFNNDGFTDVLGAASFGGNVYLNDGAGKFTKTNFSLLVTSGAAIADFDQDGNLDLAFTSAGTTSVAFGQGDGGFEFPTSFPNLAAGALAVGDLNYDGAIDLVSVSSLGICVLTNNNGNFNGPQYYNPYGGQAVRLADLNNDNHLDMIAASGSPNVMTVRQKNERWFWSLTDYGLGATVPFGVGVADFNGDRNLDLAVRGAWAVLLFLGRGDGSFVPGPQIPVAGGTYNSDGTFASDMDSDGLPDLVVEGNGSISVVFNRTPPAMRIIPMAGFHQIRWSAALGADYVLECTSDVFDPGSWVPFPNPPVLMEGEARVTDSSDSSQKFYRLRKPAH